MKPVRKVKEAIKRNTTFKQDFSIHTNYLGRNAYNRFYFLSFLCFLFNLDCFPILDNEDNNGLLSYKKKKKNEKQQNKNQIIRVSSFIHPFNRESIFLLIMIWMVVHPSFG